MPAPALKPAPAPAPKGYGKRVARSDVTAADQDAPGASVRRRVRDALARWFPPAQIAVALRAALAAMAAWLLGNLLPGDVRQFAYAAALGAFVATGTTLLTVARTALQQAVALAIGAGLGLAMLNLELPGLAKIGIIAAVAVLLPGTAALGGSAGVVPVVALLVIMFGGPDADGYAIGYVGEFTLGLVVGVLVNLVALPPLHDRAARERIRAEVRAIADRVEGLAETLRGPWPPESSDWVGWGDELEEDIEHLSAQLNEARESRRFNPRAVGRRHSIGRDERSLATVRSVAHRMVTVLEALASAAWSAPVEVDIADDERALSAEAMDALAEHLRAWSVPEGVEEASAAFGEAIDRLYQQVMSRAQPESGVATLVFALRAMRDRIDRAAEAERHEA